MKKMIPVVIAALIAGFVGAVIGSTFTARAEQDKTGDILTARSLLIYDDKGELAISMGTSKSGAGITFFDSKKMPTILISSGDGVNISLTGHDGRLAAVLGINPKGDPSLLLKPRNSDPWIAP